MLKLGTETGSLVNHIYSAQQSAEAEPTVGMHATLLHWTDREPAEIIEVRDARTITLRALAATRVDRNGMSESQEYAFASDPTAAPFTARRTRKGWITADRNPETGRWVTSGTRVVLGRAEKYHDFSF